jgi:hypothetical protein
MGIVGRKSITLTQVFSFNAYNLKFNAVVNERTSQYANSQQQDFNSN